MAIKRHMLSKRDVKELVGEAPWLSEAYGSLEEVEVIEVRDDLRLYKVGDEVAVVKATVKVNEANRDVTYPTLLAANKYPVILNYYPVAQVDEGAVKPIATGADVMRPGIKGLSRPFKVGDVVLVRSPSGRIIAITVSLFESEELMRMSRGRVLKNIHHVNDEVWRLMSGEHEHK
ncbi:MAG: PUA domain-containing protein [Caldivirga sp.]|jgi:PUA domain protein